MSRRWPPPCTSRATAWPGGISISTHSHGLALADTYACHHNEREGPPIHMARAPPHTGGPAAAPEGLHMDASFALVMHQRHWDCWMECPFRSSARLPQEGPCAPPAALQK